MNFQEILNSLEIIHKEYLILKRMLYKVNNTLRRQKQFHYLRELKKLIEREILVTINNLNNLQKTENCIFYFN